MGELQWSKSRGSPKKCLLGGAGHLQAAHNNQPHFHTKNNGLSAENWICKILSGLLRLLGWRFR